MTQSPHSRVLQYTLQQRGVRWAPAGCPARRLAQAAPGRASVNRTCVPHAIELRQLRPRTCRVPGAASGASSAWLGVVPMAAVAVAPGAMCPKATACAAGARPIALRLNCTMKLCSACGEPLCAVRLSAGPAGVRSQLPSSFRPLADSTAAIGNPHLTMTILGAACYTVCHTCIWSLLKRDCEISANCSNHFKFGMVTVSAPQQRALFTFLFGFLILHSQISMQSKYKLVI